MASELREFYIPILFISLIIGYQISIYFLHRYYKVREEKFGFNKVLLAYGLFFATAFTGYLIRTINNYYITDPFLIEVINPVLVRFTVGSAVIIFLIIISSKPFHEILNPNLTKIVIIAMVIEVSFIFFFPPATPGNFFAILLYLIGLSYMSIFHLKFISQSIGIIKKKLIIILIGEIICIGSLLIGSNLPEGVIFEQTDDLINVIAILTFYLGLMTIFLGVFRIPPFLEFQWEKNLLSLYIIDSQNLKGLYRCDFKELLDNRDFPNTTISENRIRKDFFPNGYIGIDKIITTITNTKNEKIEKIEHGDFLILVEQGDEPQSSIIFTLLVKKETHSMRFFLKTLKNQFQDFYGNLLLYGEFLDGREIQVFSSFDFILKNILINQLK